MSTPHTRSFTHSHSPVKPLPCLSPPCFPSINSVTPSSGPCHYRKTEQGMEGKRREEHCRKRRNRNCECKRDGIKVGVRRAGAWKKIEREQVLKWVRSKWGTCEWFPQCHEATWGRLQLRVKERWSKLDGLHIWWEELVPRKSLIIQREVERKRVEQKEVTEWELLADRCLEYTVYRGLEGWRVRGWVLIAHGSEFINQQQRHFCCMCTTDVTENTLALCQCLWSRGRIPGADAAQRNLSCFVPR